MLYPAHSQDGLLEYSRLQVESRTRNDEYNIKSRQLHTELESHKQERRTLRDRVVKFIQDQGSLLIAKVIWSTDDFAGQGH